MNENNNDANIEKRIDSLIAKIESKNTFITGRSPFLYKKLLRLYETGIDFCHKCSEKEEKLYVGEIIFSDSVDSITSLTGRILRDMNKKTAENKEENEESEIIMNYHLAVLEKIRQSINSLNISENARISKSQVSISYSKLRKDYLSFLKDCKNPQYNSSPEFKLSEIKNIE